VLKAMESSAADFFDHIRRLTLEGMFGDPYYGGNRGFAGWDLIRYPGVRLAVSPQEQKTGALIGVYNEFQKIEPGTCGVKSTLCAL